MMVSMAIAPVSCPRINEPKGTPMNLSALLAARTAQGTPVRIGLIGAGKFGSMILAQARHIPGYHIVGIADLDVSRAQASLARVHWEEDRYSAPSLTRAVASGATHVTDDAASLFPCSQIEVIIEATGHPIAGVRHALGAIDAGKHVIMVNVEADVMCGPVLAARAERAGVVYSMAYGDQPAAICELVDWVHACGFELVAAGKGMNFAQATAIRHRTRSGTISTLPRNRWHPATSIPRCTTPLPMAPRPPSKWPPSPMRPGWTVPATGWHFLPPGFTTWPTCSSRPARADAWKRPASSISPQAANPMGASCRTTSNTGCSSPSGLPMNTPASVSTNTG